MSDDENEMAAMREAGKYQSFQHEKERIGTKQRTILEKYAPKDQQIEDSSGFFIPKNKPLIGTKRDEPQQNDDISELPQDFGRKAYAEDPSEIHETHTRKILGESEIKEKLNTQNEDQENEEEGMFGPQIPNEILKAETEKFDNSEYSDFIKEGLFLPISHQVSLQGHSRGVIALDVDPAGNRLISGGGDYQLNIYDFQGMNEKLRPFRTLQPYEGYPVTCLDFNSTGSNLLVSAGKNTVKVYTRDGIEVQETIKGDMYLRDMVHTKGHTETVNEAHWNPTQKNLFLTISYDGTMRLWDLLSKHVGFDQNIMHQSLMKLKGKNSVKSQGNTCCYSSEADLIAGGTTEGGIHIWHNKGYFAAPDFINLYSHPNAEVSSLCFSQDSLQLYSRATDHTMKLWDLRNFKIPVHTWENLPNDSPRAQVSLSPDGKYVLTVSTIVNPHNIKNSVGRVIICDTQNFEIVGRVNVCHNPVYRVQWVKNINQIIVGCGDGSTRVLYDPDKSEKGVISALSKKVKTNIEDHIEYQRPIITLDTVHIIKRDKPKIIRDAEARDDPKLTKKPEPPMKGKLVSHSLTAYIMTQIHKNTDRDIDAKEALLKYADFAEKNPEWVAPAYQKTQPKPVFDYSAPTSEEIKFLEKKVTKICPKCGLKFCSCNKKLGDNDIVEEEKTKNQ